MESNFWDVNAISKLLPAAQSCRLRRRPGNPVIRPGDIIAPLSLSPKFSDHGQYQVKVSGVQDTRPFQRTYFFTIKDGIITSQWFTDNP